jgi:NADH:ubiquinone oxidoreductase subunit E
MIIISICIGSACHLKGAERIVALFQEAVEKNHLEDQIALTGSFCTGRCNRVGVTITVDDDVYTGITPESFDEFFRDKVLAKLNRG